MLPARTIFRERLSTPPSSRQFVGVIWNDASEGAPVGSTIRECQVFSSPSRSVVSGSQCK